MLEMSLPRAVHFLSPGVYSAPINCVPNSGPLLKHLLDIKFENQSY